MTECAKHIAALKLSPPGLRASRSKAPLKVPHSKAILALPGGIQTLTILIAAAIIMYIIVFFIYILLNIE